MKNLLVLLIAFSAISALQAQPKEIRYIREDWPNSQTDYASLQRGGIINVGLGNGEWGYGFLGVEMEGTMKVVIEMISSTPFSKSDPNSFAGFIIDYHTAKGYTKRMLLSIGMHDETRWDVTPTYGSHNKGNDLRYLGLRNSYEIDFGTYAPAGWDGKVIFTVGIQNAGINSSISAKWLYPNFYNY